MGGGGEEVKLNKRLLNSVCCAVTGAPGWICETVPEIVKGSVELIEDETNLPQHLHQSQPHSPNREFNPAIIFNNVFPNSLCLLGSNFIS